MKTITPFFLIMTLLSDNTNTKIETQNIKTNQMDIKNYTSTIMVDKDAKTSFNAIQNFRAWWSEEIQGSTDKLGETFFYHYKDVHLCKLKLVEEIPNKKLVYLATDNEFSFTKDKTEWINTKLIFHISEEGEKSKITFIHEGLTPQYECYELCNDAWTSYIQGSLKNLIETGTGKPNFKEGGLNAELVEKWRLPNK